MKSGDNELHVRDEVGMSEQSAFAAAILAAPHDNTARLVFADWLAERADPRAGAVRLALRLRANYGPTHPNHSRSFWQEIGRGIEPAWWVQEARRLADEVTDRVGDGAKTAVLIALALAEASLLFRNDEAGDVAAAWRSAATEAVESVSGSVVRASSIAEVSRGLSTAALGTGALVEALLSAFSQAGRDGCLRIEAGTESPAAPQARTTVQEGLRFALDGPAHQDGRKLQPAAVLVSLRALRGEEAQRALQVIELGTDGLLCCCPGLDAEAAERFRAAGARAIVWSAAHGRWRDCFEDVAAATGARAIGSDEERVKITARRLGRAGSVRVERGHLVVRQPAGPPGGGPRWIDHLHQLIDGTTGEEQEWHSHRLAQLAGAVVTVEVCGASPAETEQLYGRACNALHACRATIAEGYVPGGGAAYLRAAPVERPMSPALRWALEEPCRALLAHTPLDTTETLTALRGDEALVFDVVGGELLPWQTDGPIDPVRVVRAAIEGAFGSASRAFTAGQIR